MTLQIFGIILSALLGFTATMTSTMVLFTLNTMKQRIIKLEVGQEKLADRKAVCNQDFVDKVAYIRSTNNLEEGLKELMKEVGKLGGSMEVIKQMPQICGSIAKEFVKEMKHNG